MNIHISDLFFNYEPANLAYDHGDQSGFRQAAQDFADLVYNGLNVALNIDSLIADYEARI